MFSPQMAAISWIMDYLEMLISMYGQQCTLGDARTREYDRLGSIAINELNKWIIEEQKKVN